MEFWSLIVLVHFNVWIHSEAPVPYVVILTRIFGYGLTRMCKLTLTVHELCPRAEDHTYFLARALVPEPLDVGGWSFAQQLMNGSSSKWHSQIFYRSSRKTDSQNFQSAPHMYWHSGPPCQHRSSSSCNVWPKMAGRCGLSSSLTCTSVKLNYLQQCISCCTMCMHGNTCAHSCLASPYGDSASQMNNVKTKTASQKLKDTILDGTQSFISHYKCCTKKLIM